MIPSLDSAHDEAQEQKSKNTPTSSGQERKVISATRRANKRAAVNTVTQAEAMAGQAATPSAREEMDTTSEPTHKKVHQTKTLHKHAEADRSDSPITVSPPQAEVTEEDSNLSRTKATQTDSQCTSQAVQTTDLSQGRV